MSKLLCGKCNVCCVVYNIDKSDMFWRDTNKEVGERCDKLANGQCSVYKDRPHACRMFECLWLQLLNNVGDIPTKWRPDNLGIVVSTFYDETEGRYHFKIKELKKGAFDLYNLSSELDGFLKVIFGVAKQQKADTIVTIFLHGAKGGYELKQNLGG